VLPIVGFAAINMALGHMIKSSGTRATMDTIGFMGLAAGIPPATCFLQSTPPMHKQHTPRYEFKDVVKAR